jgi:1-deoxy-D-xylulose-5-phosphate synthase
MKYDTVDFFEEGIKSGGIGERVGAMLLAEGYKGKYAVHAIDNKFVPQASVEGALKSCGLDAEAMRKTILERIEGK